MSEIDAHQIQRAGAVIEAQPDIEVTVVDWPGDSLRDFILLDVLLHEVGHHILQHNKGKRTKRVARTRDHEAFARLFVERCRALWLDERSPK